MTSKEKHDSERNAQLGQLKTWPFPMRGTTGREAQQEEAAVPANKAAEPLAWPGQVTHAGETERTGLRWGSGASPGMAL